MLIWTVIIFILLHGNCEGSQLAPNLASLAFTEKKASTGYPRVGSSGRNKGKHKVHKISNENISKEDLFYIQVKTNLNDGNFSRNKTYTKNGEYACDLDKTVELICVQNLRDKNTTLRWTDSDRFATDQHEVRALRLIIKPEYDIHLKLTCRASGPTTMKFLSVKLVGDGRTNDAKSDAKAKKYNNIMYLRDGETFKNNHTCYGVVHTPNHQKNSSLPDEVVIKSFGKEQNGTVVFCVTYKNLGLQGNVDNLMETHERRMSRVTLLLKLEQDIEKPMTPKATVNKAESPALGPISGGVAGASIIIILISVFTVRRYNKNKRNRTANKITEIGDNTECDDHLYEIIDPNRHLPTDNKSSVFTPSSLQSDQLKESKHYHLYDTPCERRATLDDFI